MGQERELVVVTLLEMILLATRVGVGQGHSSAAPLIPD
jgi:hypothetical protein